MAQTFNSPPGWPKPPEGWTPPPAWSPDPSWPQAPEGWQFWVEDPFTAALAPGSGPTETPSAASPTQTMGTSPTQVIPPSSGQPTLYSYGPSSGLEQPGASPYGPQGPPPQGGGYPGGGGYQGAQYSSPGAPAPRSRNPLAIIAVVVVAVLVLGGIAWGLSSVLGGGDEDPTAGEPSTTVTDDPTSDEPTDDPTTDEPTDDPTTDEPTDPATTDDGGGTAGVVDLTGTDPAVVNGAAGAPVAEIRLIEAVAGWESSTPSSLCSPAENGQYLGLQLEFTTLPALADESTPTYTFIGWELGAEVDGVAIETNAFSTGLFCVGSDERPPSDMAPGETYTGWAVLDVPESVTAVTFEDMFDFSGAQMYRWVLADQ
jgi:hypothetical protein